MKPFAYVFRFVTELFDWWFVKALNRRAILNRSDGVNFIFRNLQPVL